MPGKNKTPLLGWHPPAELAEWVRAEAVRRGVTVTTILNETVQAAKTRSERDDLEQARATTRLVMRLEGLDGPYDDDPYDSDALLGNHVSKGPVDHRMADVLPGFI